MTVEGTQFDKSNFVMFGPGRFTLDLGSMHQNNNFFVFTPHASNPNNEVRIELFHLRYNRRRNLNQISLL